MSQENDVKSMIDEMLEDYEPKTEEEPVVDEPELEPEPIEEEPVAEAEEPEGTPEEEESPVEGEDDGGETPEDSETQLQKLIKQNELLQQRLNEAYTKVPQQYSEDHPPKTTEKPDFFGEWKYEEIIDNEESFKKFLSEFADKVKGYTEESLNQSLPGEVSRIANTQMSVVQRAEKFFDEHQALAKVRPYVATLTGQVANENPKWNMDQVLEETAKRAYEALGLSPETVQEIQQKTKAKQKPAFADTKTKGNRGKPVDPQLSEMEKEILDLIEM